MKNKNFRKKLLTRIFQGIGPVMSFKAPSAIRNAYGFFFFYGIATGAGVMIGGMIDGDI